MCMENSIQFRTNCTSQSFGFLFPGWVKYPRPEVDPIQLARKSGAPFQREANNGGLLMCWCWWSGHHRSARSEDKRIVSLRINPRRPHSARCFIFIMSDPCGLKPGYYYITNRYDQCVGACHSKIVVKGEKTVGLVTLQLIPWWNDVVSPAFLREENPRTDLPLPDYPRQWLHSA